MILYHGKYMYRENGAARKWDDTGRMQRELVMLRSDKLTLMVTPDFRPGPKSCGNFCLVLFPYLNIFSYFASSSLITE